MKKLIFTTMAISALFLSVSCQKENVIDAPKGESAVFTAYVDGATPESKTVIHKEGEKTISYWNGEEEIGLLDGKLNTPKVYSATVKNPSATAVFIETDSNISLTGSSYRALYPASPAGSAQWQGGNEAVTGLWLTGDQTPFEGTYDPISHIAVASASADNTTLMFKNAVSYFKLTVASDVNEVCIFSHLGEKISGNFSIKYDGSENQNPVVTADGNYLLGYAKITAKDRYPITANNTYYIGVLPCTFNAGFSVEFVSGKEKKTVKTTTKEFILERNSIVDLGTIEYKDAAKKNVYLEVGEGSGWDANYAVLAVYYFGEGLEAGWAKFRKTSDTNKKMYVASIPAGYPKIILTRHDPKAEVIDFSKGSLWNQTNDLTYNDGPYFKITGFKDDKGVVESRKAY